ncbi:hypothetical protein QE152_g19515 [Popillia japonica]|uniref:Uncharacterized protein n=1 Tax=Popillia japonica TaxID=7064 RepID=A0AAW1KRA2_POPJA
MYVRWRVLIGLGTAFWVLLCLVDYLPIRQLNYLVVHEHQQQPPVKIEKRQLPPSLKQNKPDEDSFGFVKALLWNLLAFASTIAVCFLLKSISNKVNIINNQALLLEHNQERLAVKKTSSSRIPIPITCKSSSTDIHLASGEDGRESDYNKSCPNLTGCQDNDDRIKIESKSTLNKIRSIKMMERHCAKLREEMMNLEAVSLKERSSIGKKMETLLREKRELMKQSNSVSKENRSLKMQIDEMLEERTLLIRRLECATKEMKNATKNKKATIAKLDEAVSNAESLKTNLEQIKRDKTSLEDKKETDVGNKLLYQDDSIEDGCKVETDRDALTQTSEYNVANSDDDIKKVQEKLLKLEKSLENFKLRHGTREETAIGDSKEVSREDGKEQDKKDVAGEVCEILADNPQESDAGDESSPSTVATTEDSEVPTVCIYSGSNSKASLDKKQSSNSICTEPDCPLEHKECNRAECFLRRKLLERKAQRMQQSRMFPEKKIIRTQRPRNRRLSIISEMAASAGEDSGEDCLEPKRRFVTRSPAFQKFLKEALEASSSKISLDLTK